MSWLTDIAEKLGIEIPPPPVAWLPTYQPQQYVSYPLGNGTMGQAPINVEFLVDLPTAQHLLATYDPNGTIISTPFMPVGSPDTSTATVYELQWPNGVTIVAGELAELLTNNANNPTVGDSLVKAAIAARGAA
jgi:hypothetical protein